MTIGQFTPNQARLRRTRTLLEGLGLSQAITYSLVNQDEAHQFTIESSEGTEVAWPMTKDHAVLRENLVAGLINAEQYNVARKQAYLALYEQGRVFLRKPGHVRPEEHEYVAWLFTGHLTSKNWHQEA